MECVCSSSCFLLRLLEMSCVWPLTNSTQCVFCGHGDRERYPGRTTCDGPTCLPLIRAFRIAVPHTPIAAIALTVRPASHTKEQPSMLVLGTRMVAFGWQCVQ